MKEQIAIQQLLQRKFAEAKKRNPDFSLRAYSKKVGVHAGALSHILNGKRNVSKVMAERLIHRLMLGPQERSEILELFPKRRRSTKAEVTSLYFEPRYLELTAMQFKIASEWEHLAVMSLAKCEDARACPDWIASRLNISSARAKTVLKRLQELNLVQAHPAGRLSRSKINYRTPDDVADIALKKHHDQSFDLARESLYRESVSDRDMTSLTMAIDPKKLSTAKDLIRKFQDDLSDLLESGNKTEVYRLSVQLFPLSVLRGEKHK